MTADLYCARSDVAKRLPPGALISSSGIVASALAATDTVTYDGHGFETNDPLRVRAVEGGALAAPLVDGTTYFAIRLSNSDFKLAATSGGSAVNLTSDAVSMVVMRDPNFDEIIEFYSRWADSFMPGHLVPFQAPIHPLVHGIVADLSAKRLLNIGGQDSAIVTAAEASAQTMLERHATGLRLRGAASSASANKSTSSSLSRQGPDPRGWGSRCIP